MSGLQKRREVQRYKCRRDQSDRCGSIDRIYTQYTAILLDRVIGWCGSVAFVYHLCACV